MGVEVAANRATWKKQHGGVHTAGLPKTTEDELADQRLATERRKALAKIVSA